MKRFINVSDAALSQFSASKTCEPLEFTRLKNENGSYDDWNNTLYFLISYDFPELHNTSFYKCLVYDSGYIIFRSINNTNVVYYLFDSGDPVNFSKLEPDLSYMKNLKNWKNNPLHYHIISLDISDEGDITYSKKYLFSNNNKHYFLLDSDGKSADEKFTADNENGFFYDTKIDTKKYSSLYFKDSATRIRLKSSIAGVNYYINETSYSANDGSFDCLIYSPDKFLNGFTLEIKNIYSSETTGTKIPDKNMVLEVWT